MFCIKFDWFWLFSHCQTLKLVYTFVVLLGSNFCSRARGLGFHYFFKAPSTKYLSPIGKLSDLTNLKTKNVRLLQDLSCRKSLGTVAGSATSWKVNFSEHSALLHCPRIHCSVYAEMQMAWTAGGWQISFFEGVRQISDPCKKLKTADGLQEMF